VRLEERRVGHRHERRIGQPRARLGEALEAGGGAHALGERAFGRAPDDRPVGERVGEREPELNEVGPAFDRRLGERGGLGPAHQVDGERRGTNRHRFVPLA
jgi:hypothetical protein